jgi:hypothetical protein
LNNYKLLEMKKENEISELSYESIGASPMTEADIIQTDALLKNAFFKDKYRNSLKSLAKSEMNLLKKQYPKWQLKDVLIAIIKDYNSELPPSIFLEMTQFIISEWERTHQEELAVC